MKRKIEELAPITYQNLLLERKTDLERTIKSKSTLLEKSRHLENKGHIRIVPHNKVLQYYLITKKGDTIGKYLQRSQNNFAEDLLTYEYNKKALSSLQNELKLITSLLSFCQKKSVEKLFTGFSKHKQKIIRPVTLSNKEYAEQWQAISYKGNPFDFSTSEFYTSKGERVRSKSEVIIADTLSRLNIPYRYEYPLELKNQNYTIYPDFCCLNLSTRKEIYWEHFGMMDDTEYATKAVNKINSMSSNGYFSGKNAIFTFETQVSPLNTKNLEKIIDEYLA